MGKKQSQKQQTPAAAIAPMMQYAGTESNPAAGVSVKSAATNTTDKYGAVDDPRRKRASVGLGL